MKTRSFKEVSEDVFTPAVVFLRWDQIIRKEGIYRLSQGDETSYIIVLKEAQVLWYHVKGQMLEFASSSTWSHREFVQVDGSIFFSILTEKGYV